MKDNKPRVGIVGGFQMGKSTLINCLLDAKVARTGGLGIAVTSVITRYTYGNMQSVNYFSEGRVVHTCRLHEFLEDTTVIPNADIPTVDEVVITLWKPLLKYIDLIDTPGFKANDRDTFTTLEAMKGIDIVVVLLNNKSLDSKEVEIFNAMNRSGKPFLVLINCVNQGGVLWDPAAEQNKHIFSEIEGRIRNIGCSPIHIPGRMSWGCNLMWYWYASDQYLQDNKQQVELTESQTAHFAKTFLKLSPDDRPAMAERSNFLSIRALFENGDDWGFPVNFLRWSSGINDSFTDWEDSIKKLVNEL